MRTVKIGIIGCGGIANEKHLPALRKVENVEIVALCDIIPERAKNTKKKFGLKGAKVYKSYHNLLKMEEIEAVHVLTHNSMHAKITIDALNAGKHVLCEKPMATTSREARAMIEAAKRNNKKLTIGYQTRSNVIYKYARKLVAEGKLGDVYYVRAPEIRRRGAPGWGVFLNKEKQGGGPMIDIGTHGIDIALYVINNYEVESVTGSTFKKLVGKCNVKGMGDYNDEDFTVEDSAMGYVKFKNGCTLVVEASFLINMETPGCRMFCGSDAGLEMRGGKPVINGERYNEETKEWELYSEAIEITPEMASEVREICKDRTEISFSEYEARMWFNAIINDTDPQVKPEEACVITEIIEAIYKSAATGKTVYFK